MLKETTFHIHLTRCCEQSSAYVLFSNVTADRLSSQSACMHTHTWYLVECNKELSSSLHRALKHSRFQQDKVNNSVLELEYSSFLRNTNLLHSPTFSLVIMTLSVYDNVNLSASLIRARNNKRQKLLTKIKLPNEESALQNRQSRNHVHLLYSYILSTQIRIHFTVIKEMACPRQHKIKKTV